MLTLSTWLRKLSLSLLCKNEEKQPAEPYQACDTLVCQVHSGRSTRKNRKLVFAKFHAFSCSQHKVKLLSKNVI